ncbi:MAG: hypothetical protein ACE5JB_16870, partial [bacterium]
KRKDVEKILEITDRAGGLERVENLMQKSAESACYYVRNLRWNKHFLTLLVEATVLPLNG